MANARLLEFRNPPKRNRKIYTDTGETKEIDLKDFPNVILRRVLDCRSTPQSGSYLKNRT